MQTKLTLAEQETVISFDRSSDTMTVYTADPYLLAKLAKRDTYKKIKECKQGKKVVAMTFEADKRLLTLRAARPKRKSPTEKS